MKSKLITSVQLIAIALIFLIFTLLSFGVYTERTLNGNVDNHILAGKMFGTPKDLIEKGVKPLYTGPKETGWDGQFYFYMANDLLALKDTEQHIDANAYRYQRIGMSLYAATFAKITGQDWVSPKTFLISYFVLVFAATIVGALVLKSFGLSSAIILLWALSIGTQITLFNALPDAAADAFLILALAATFRKKYFLAAVAFTFSSLSREVYVLFPTLIFLFLFWEAKGRMIFKSRFTFSEILTSIFTFRKFYILLAPGFICLSWRIYVELRFGVSPSEQAHGILGTPLAAWWKYFESAIKDEHLLVGSGFSAYAEALSLIFFLLIIVFVAVVSYKVAFSKNRTVTPEIRGISVAALCFAILYSCFGSTVMMHYTGYLKAVCVFFFILPLIVSQAYLRNLTKIFIYLSLFILFTVSTIYNMKVRILPFNTSHDKYTSLSSVTGTERLSCINDYSSEITVNSINIINKSLFSHFFGGEKDLVIDLTVKNTSKHNFKSTKNFGSFHISYHWIDNKGQVVVDGIRSALKNEIKPGQTLMATIVTKIPKNNEELTLVPSLVQEGCAWFYLTGKSKNIGIEIKTTH